MAAAEWRFFRPVMGATLAVLCGLILWGTPIGDPWVNASYDYQFRFSSRMLTNQVVLIEMDNESYSDLHQERYDPNKEGSLPWDRKLHAQLLKKLADGGASLVVMDIIFSRPFEKSGDDALAEALRLPKKVIISAKQAAVVHPKVYGVQPTMPDERFLDAAGTNWGVAWLDPDLDLIVRKHWPFPSPGPSTPKPDYYSLPWEAALVAGAPLDNDVPRERWLRYYHEGTWARISYRHALLEEPPSWFRDKIVFIGNEPQYTATDKPEDDKFRTPFTRWTGEACGGVDINITAFLNLMNGDWLERPPLWAEALALVLAGILLGGGLCLLRPLTALSTAAIAAVVITLGSASWTYFGNHWFPWLVIAGGQVPFALAWAIFMPAFHRVQETITIATQPSRRKPKRRAKTPAAELPDTPDYELFDPPFGEGAYGKVWVVKNAIGQWQALKVVYLSKFDNNTDPFDREFNGISRYKPISDRHPGLLRVDFVSRKREGYFYYVMELGDALEPGWEREPSGYQPRDLASIRKQSPSKRLPVRECIRIGIALSDALDFLHQQGLTHRDIKPQNVIFVNGHPKLADVGLTAEIRPLEAERTFVGTPGYMPPPPERPGSPQADIYALGMVLYVLSTGRSPSFFPEIATTLVKSPDPADFLPLNAVILKACDPDCSKRYQTAAHMRQALEHLETTFASSLENSQNPSKK
jgi:CHASE2 domain-containing sensor protein